MCMFGKPTGTKALQGQQRDLQQPAAHARNQARLLCHRDEAVGGTREPSSRRQRSRASAPTTRPVASSTWAGRSGTTETHQTPCAQVAQPSKIRAPAGNFLRELPALPIWLLARPGATKASMYSIADVGGPQRTMPAQADTGWRASADHKRGGKAACDRNRVNCPQAPTRQQSPGPGRCTRVGRQVLRPLNWAHFAKGVAVKSLALHIVHGSKLVRWHHQALAVHASLYALIELPWTGPCGWNLSTVGGLQTHRSATRTPNRCSWPPQC